MSIASKERLYTGLYECSDCDARYELNDAFEEDLVCDECGADLELQNDDGDQENE